MISINWDLGRINVQDQNVDPAKAMSLVSEFITDSRKQKIDKVLSSRSSHFVPVLESIYDRGNISAVMRSAEAFGFYDFHIVETDESFKESARVTQGADKWLDIKKWSKTSDCIHSLKEKGYKVYTTHLSEEAKNFNEVSFDEPVALILGNEKDGVSKEALEMSDGNVLLPMVGFTQSFNISVAGALSCYTAYQKIKEEGKYLSIKERELLEALYFLRSVTWSEDQLVKFLV